jgi:(2R)-3-sulfolactate dehydrogenase (NADP+)
MTDLITLSRSEAESLAGRALIAHKTKPANAQSVARALVSAEIDGQKGHGLSRVASYAAQAQIGKVTGDATPKLIMVKPAIARIDGGFGFAFPALDLAVATLPTMVKTEGMAGIGIFHSHHFGQAGATVERLARIGLVALLFGNTPKAMALWGGKKPMLGTNPIAFACPLAGADPLVIDLALSEVARGKIVNAAKAKQKIPLGWALDGDGQPTEDAEQALKGSMLPFGGVKGFSLALMVEILAAALTGSHFGFEASSVLDAQGSAPDLGQFILAIDPDTLSDGAFSARMAVLAAAFADEPGARFPGIRRLKNRQDAASGLAIPAALHHEIQTLGDGPAVGKLDG